MNTGPIITGTASRVLIADDERKNRDLLEIMLAPEGFDLVSVASGEEALAEIARLPPDLILLDVLMPGLGGYEVAARLKSKLATKHIPIIMITALDDRDAKMFGLRAGAEDFLNKPIDRAELCVRVRNLLRLKAHTDATLAHRDDAMGMVSHDLRNLLSGIVMSAELLDETSSDSEEGRRTSEGLQRILQFTKRMNRLIGDLVDVVSLDAGKLALQAQHWDATLVLSEAVRSGAQAAEAKGISISAGNASGPLWGTFDRERILQVFANLIANAVKFTGPGGAIVVDAARAGDDLRFTVRDSGAGIPPDMLEAVFQRYSQVRQNDQRGLGLGLYISRCIVESHGGQIWVESTLGVGSVFQVLLPIAARVDRAVARSSDGGSVLVVDDDPALCETLALWLVRRGFVVASCGSAEEAVALVTRQSFDAIVTDLHLGDTDGIALCERVLSLRPGLPVLVTSGFGTRENRAAALRAGAHEFLPKPYDLEVLRETLARAVLAGRATNAVKAAPPSERVVD